jgi:hypothetical protein
MRIEYTIVVQVPEPDQETGQDVHDVHEVTTGIERGVKAEAAAGGYEFVSVRARL